MAEVLPFRALRYSDDVLASVVAPPYDVINAEDREKIGARSPHNVVHLDLPKGEGDARYANAAALLQAWQEENVLTRDAAPSFVIYSQTFSPPGGGAPITRRGFFGLVRTEPYEKRVVLPHERTLSGPKEDRYKLFCATRTALSPVFLLYRDRTGVIAKTIASSQATTHFKTDDGIEHAFSRVTDPATIAAMTNALENEQLLIADGHHRYETTLRYGDSIDAERAKQGLPAAPRGAHRYLLAFLTDGDDPGLAVFPTHRLVHSLADFSKEKLLGGARALFDVESIDAEPLDALTQKLAASGKQAPSVALVFGDGSAALLRLRADANLASVPALASRPDVLRKMDVVLLHSGLLESVCGITIEQQAAQTNLAYYKIARDAVADLKAGKGQFLALMNGTPVADVRAACEAGEVMPQKATFFYPKVPTGLVMHVLDPNEEIASPSKR